jgi:hypothetical protein
MAAQKNKRQWIGGLSESSLQIEAVHLRHAQISQHTPGCICVTLREKFMR